MTAEEYKLACLRYDLWKLRAKGLIEKIPHSRGRSAVRLVLDNPAASKTILDRQRTDYRELEVATVTLAHRPGELARVAARLGEAGINIDYGYCGVDPSTSGTMLLLGVADAGKAAKVLEQAAAASATS